MKRCKECGRVQAARRILAGRTDEDGLHARVQGVHNATWQETAVSAARGSRDYHVSRRYGIGAAAFNGAVRRHRVTFAPICEKPESRASSTTITSRRVADPVLQLQWRARAVR